MKIKALAICFLGGFVATSSVSSVAFSASVEPVTGENGMVVTAQNLASQVGIDILKKGGNAVDAAVAVGYALAVVYPSAGNLGGGGFATLSLSNGQKTFIDFREKAPLAAHKNMYLDKDGNIIKGLSTVGHLAVAVPGTVAGLEHLREKYGTLPRKDLIAPAIELAKKGFTLTQGDVKMLKTATTAFRQDAPTAKIFLKKNVDPFETGDKLIQSDLARTLTLISEKGKDGFYKGETAQKLVKSSQAGKGIITQADLERYQVREMSPIECDYRGYHVISAPPPSSGGVSICQILNIVEGYPLKEWGYGSAQSIHHTIEAMKYAYVDRNSHLGDPAFIDNPTAQLTDKKYADSIRQKIKDDKATPSREIKDGFSPQEGQNTTHYSIIDKQGNAVSLTYTLNDWFGAKVTADGTGVLLNNEMDDFTSKVNEPNIYGLVQGHDNIIEPEKRPLSSMSPTILTRDNKPFMVVGTPGGSRIITTVVHTILNVIDYGMDVQEAVDAPRFHQQWLPEKTSVEFFALNPDTKKILENMGHEFSPPHEANHVAAILVGSPAIDKKPIDKAVYYGANDPRRGTGSALGY